MLIPPQLVEKFPAFHGIWTFHCRVHKSPPRPFVTFRNMQVLSRWGIVSPRPKKLDYHLLSAVRDGLFAATLHPQPEVAPCRGDTEPIYMQSWATWLTILHEGVGTFLGGQYFITLSRLKNILGKVVAFKRNISLDTFRHIMYCFLRNGPTHIKGITRTYVY